MLIQEGIVEDMRGRLRGFVLSAEHQRDGWMRVELEGGPYSGIQMPYRAGVDEIALPVDWDFANVAIYTVEDDEDSEPRARYAGIAPNEAGEVIEDVAGDQEADQWWR